MRNNRIATFGSILFVIGCLLVNQNVKAQKAILPVYKDSTKQVEERITDLLNRMTLPEKVELLGGTGTETIPNVRLGIPKLVITDGPLGPNKKGKATNYSSCINMAATFDDDLINKVGKNIGEESRVLGFNMLLGPCINIARVPHGGRTFESFGEDPYLMSRMTVAYIKGVQIKRVITCTKHYVCNNQEWNRFDVDARLDERSLREIYLPAFKAAVREADGWSIMAAYNQTMGHYCCESRYLITDILKGDWGFSGFVVTDWGGARSTIKMAHSGLDLEMPNGKFYGDNLLQAVKSGEVEESTVNDKVRCILRVMLRAGLFDESVADYGGFADTPERRALALQVAQKSIILLKNEDQCLPLDKQNIISIAVIGPNGNVARMFGGGSGSLNGHYGISPLQGIREKAGNNVAVYFKRGIPEQRMELPIADSSYFIPPNAKPGEYGLKAEFFNNRELQGEPVLVKVDKNIDFDWGYGTRGPGDGPGSPKPGVVNLDKWSARWTGKFKSPGDGVYEIGLQADNGVRLYLDEQLLIDWWTDAKPGKFKIVKYRFEVDRIYDMRVEFYENWGSCRCKLGIAPYDVTDVQKDAVDLAQKCHVSVLCMGLNAEMEGEALDRESLSLPDDQIELIKAVSKVSKKCIVVLNNATPVIMNEWIDNVPAIIEALYPGQEGGRALADILFGDVSPSGRLPLTFIKNWNDSPVAATYPGEKAYANYSEGIFVGYRYFDKNEIEPLFPFGYGLSYTSFSYSNLKISPGKITKNDTIYIQLLVKNSGVMDGDEVVQLYIRDVEASIEREVKALKGFKRITLKSGESKNVLFKLGINALSFYNVQEKRWVAEPGEFEVMIGSSSRDIRLKDSFSLTN